MRSRPGRQRRFGAGPATMPILMMATRAAPIGMPANPGHMIQHCRHLLPHME
jgi:hypothetical protein